MNRILILQSMAVESELNQMAWSAISYHCGDRL